MEIVSAADAGEWETWVAAHHGESAGALLKIAKAGSGITSVTLAEAADICLCYGWIDSVRRSFDESFYLQKYGPRRRTSSWSQVNVAKAERLIAAGRMRPPGFAEIALAKDDGRWQAAYESQKNATTPPDVAAALAQDPAAKARFDLLSSTQQYVLCLPLLKSRSPDLRAARLAKLLSSLR